MSPIKLTTGVILNHCKARVEKLCLKRPCAFKIGLTENPGKRWSNCKYGYGRDKRAKWQQMTVLYCSSANIGASWCETALIDYFIGKPGNQNILKGGDTMSDSEGPHFTYVVHRSLL
jgi:hypothetical protein